MSDSRKSITSLVFTCICTIDAIKGKHALGQLFVVHMTTCIIAYQNTYRRQGEALTASYIQNIPKDDKLQSQSLSVLSVRYYMTLIQIFLKVFLKIQTYYIYIANSNCLFLSNEPIFQYIRFEMNKTCFY